MAIMYPSRLCIHTKSPAEKILFKEFENQLPNDYVVIHSKNWIKADRKGHVEKQGECDFIVLHPAKGILFVEAKPGNTFYCSGLDELWYCKDGQSFRNPNNQAVESQYAIIELLNKSIPGFNLPFNVALAFPQADTISENLPSNLLPSMVILEPDIQMIHSKVDKALCAFRPALSNPIPRSVFHKIVNIVRGEFNITTSLSRAIGDLKQQFFQLEKEQVSVLNTFEKNSRVVVEGVAGSGKTMIAIEKAARAALQGKRVLMLCFNIPLAEEIRNQTAKRRIEADVFHFHGLAEHVVKSTGGIFPSEILNPNAFWNEDCADLLDAAVSDFTERYDCIIVDEAQDFIEGWWVPIKKLLKDVNDSEFYIFLDPNQNIFCRKPVVLFNWMRISLNKNYRNTPAIVNWLNEAFGTKMESSDRLDEGMPPVEIRVTDDTSELSEIEKIIDSLLVTQKFLPGQIVILGQHALENSIFRDIQKISGYPISGDELLRSNINVIRYASIYRFKGLEEDCVILSGVGTKPRVDIEENLKDMLLTGASRAKILLYILCRFGT